MNEESYEIHWLESIKKQILARNQDLYTLSTGKTPSGSIHIGILREIITCDSLKRLLQDEGARVRFFLFFDSMDAAKTFPAYIPASFEEHLGKPFSDIPCPVKGCDCESYAHHWGNELVSTFDEFGLSPSIQWSHELYETSEMKKQVKISLDNTTRIKKIIMKNILPTLDEFKRVAYEKQMATWYPAMVVCDKCGTTQYKDAEREKIFANRVLGYNPGTGEIRYKCPNPSCKHEQVTTIDEARVKLNWRVDWPAKWSIFNTSCEPAGKDHSVKGGSYDTGLELCKEIFGYEGPLKLSYEWLRLGDQDMSTSGGIVFNPREYLRIGGLPEAFRHLILKTRPTSHISFRVEYLPQMQDEYERFERVYFGFEDVPDEEFQVIKYLFPIVQPVELPEKLPLRIPFKYAVVMAQVQELLDEGTVVMKCNEMARRSFPGDSPGVLDGESVFKLLDAAKYWVENYAPKHYRFNVTREPDERVTSKLNEIERKALRMLHEFITTTGADSGEDIQNQVFTIAKEQLEVSPKKVFQAIYKVFVGKKHGPRLGPFLEAMDKNFIIKRLEASYTKKE